MNRPLPKRALIQVPIGVKWHTPFATVWEFSHQAHHEGRDGMFSCIAKLDFSNPKATCVNILESSHINIEIKKR